MGKSLTQDELKVMGFTDPWPTNTMSKVIPMKHGGTYCLHVWVEKGIADYLYFATDDYPVGYAQNLLGVGKYEYPKLHSKEQLENYCLILSGKSIYDINIK
jgi:hypothetical protein